MKELRVTVSGCEVEVEARSSIVGAQELAYQVWMKNECEAFSAAVDAINTKEGWWEGMAERQAPAMAPERAHHG